MRSKDEETDSDQRVRNVRNDRPAERYPRIQIEANGSERAIHYEGPRQGGAVGVGAFILQAGRLPRGRQKYTRREHIRRAQEDPMGPLVHGQNRLAEESVENGPRRGRVPQSFEAIHEDGESGSDDQGETAKDGYEWFFGHVYVCWAVVKMAR